MSVAIKIDHAHKCYGSNVIIDDLSVRIREGEFFGVVGESGCGKSTVGRTLLHLYPPTDGEVWFDGKKHTAITCEIEDYILQGGVYGNSEQRIAMSQNKKGGKLGYILSRVFLPYNTMLIYYPSLSKCPALFPFYQVRRWFKIVFCGGRTRAFDEIKLSQNLSDVKKEKIDLLIKELGL